MKRKQPKPKANPAYPLRVARERKELAEAARRVRRTKDRADTTQRPKAVRVGMRHLGAIQGPDAGVPLAKLGSRWVVARPFAAPNLPQGVVPTGASDKRRFRPLPGESAHVALDSQMVAPTYAYANQFCSAVGFPGYPYLAELALRSEFRSAAETTAKDMTRRWLKLKSGGGGDKSKQIEELESVMKDFKVRELFRKAIENDGYFGRYQIYMDIRGQNSDQARQLPLKVGEETLGKGCLLGLAGIEPIWTTPFSYNSIDPTAPDFFKPVSWFVMGRKTHATRLLNFVSRPVPDLFKPAYNFGGLAMSQLMEPYVMQWYRTRDSVSDAIYNFSTSGVATNLSTLLEEDDAGTALARRAQHFNQTKGNKGLMVIDKDTEEFFQFNMPLAGLDKLQAQSQEHMCNPSHIPAVKFLGVEPVGLNASSEGTIKVWYDYLHSEQETLCNPPFDVLLDVLQLHCFGTIDDDITYEWVPMDEPSSKELAEMRGKDAAAGVAYIGAAVISPEEERKRLQSDPNSGYNNLSGAAPELTPEQETLGMTQEHGAEQADADREHGAAQADKDRDAAAKATKAKAKKSKD